MREFDNQIQEIAKIRIQAIEKALDADAIFIYGPIFPSIEKRFRDFIEDLKGEKSGRDRLAILLTTPGGSAETVEKLVDIVRYHYMTGVSPRNATFYCDITTASKLTAAETSY